MEGVKTLSKKTGHSSYLDNNQTAKEPKKRHQSQRLPGEVVVMHGGSGSQQFNVYSEDGLVLGSQVDAMPHISLVADEDSKTDSYIMELGISLCQRDLERAVRLPREQTQTGLSEYSWDGTRHGE